MVGPIDLTRVATEAATQSRGNRVSSQPLDTISLEQEILEQYRASRAAKETPTLGPTPQLYKTHFFA